MEWPGQRGTEFWVEGLACSEGRKMNPNLEEQSCSERSGKIRAWRALKISKADLLCLLRGQRGGLTRSFPVRGRRVAGWSPRLGFR